jgi:hypothetical protein
MCGGDTAWKRRRSEGQVLQSHVRLGVRAGILHSRSSALRSHDFALNKISDAAYSGTPQVTTCCHAANQNNRRTSASTAAVRFCFCKNK